MDIDQFAHALVALSDTRVTGVKEAAVLFIIASGAKTAKEIIELTDGRPASTRMRLVNLQEKNLIVRKKGLGLATYGLTAKGQHLVSQVTT
jgi:predicted transcriptional regulator